MPHAALRLVSGANTQETPAQNENGGISQTQLIRYWYDQNGLILVGKLGGWTPFYPSPIVTVVRALWAWEDINSQAHLALGTQIISQSGVNSTQLAVITDGVLTDITPKDVTEGSAIGFSTTVGSATVYVTDNNVILVTNVVSVYISTQVSVGGLVLFGLYQCDPDNYVGYNQYTIQARDKLGVPVAATATTTVTGAPVFSTTSGSTLVTVALGAYTYAVGETFPVLVPTVVGGITFYGNYIVQAIVDDSHFTIQSAVAATSTATGTLNSALVQLTYCGGGTGATSPYVPANIVAYDWTLDNYGQSLVACPVTQQAASPPFQPIYLWSPEQASAAILTQAPPVNDGIFVAMPQRQIIAWGSTETGIQDPLLISWCDVNNPYQWIPLVTNQAGNYRIPKGSRIVGGIQGPQQGLIWTDIDVWSMQYIGPPNVYGFNEIGSGCGMIARKAAAFLGGIGYWMGPSQFYRLSANGVQPLPCPVWDVVYQNLLQTVSSVTGEPFYYNSIRVAVNSRFNEIAWYYPSKFSTNGQNDSYVKYNAVLNLWDYGQLGRSAWIDQSVLGPPIGADPETNLLYQHETSNDAAGTAMNSYFLTGQYAINEADVKSFVDLIWPDMKWGQYGAPQTANVEITFYVSDYPGDAPTAYGPYTVTQATEYFYTRFRARLMAIKVGSTDLGSFWRIGQLRYRFAPDGKF